MITISKDNKAGRGIDSEKHRRPTTNPILPYFVVPNLCFVHSHLKKKCPNSVWDEKQRQKKHTLINVFFLRHTLKQQVNRRWTQNAALLKGLK